MRFYPAFMANGIAFNQGLHGFSFISRRHCQYRRQRRHFRRIAHRIFEFIAPRRALFPPALQAGSKPYASLPARGSRSIYCQKPIFDIDAAATDLITYRSLFHFWFAAHYYRRRRPSILVPHFSRYTSATCRCSADGRLSATYPAAEHKFSSLGRRVAAMMRVDFGSSSRVNEPLARAIMV